MAQLADETNENGEITLLPGQRWMVIWVRPGGEFTVRKRLREIGLAAFVPLERRERAASRCAKPHDGALRRAKAPSPEAFLAPAFPRYILFAATEAQPVWQLAVRVDGVSMVVRQAGDREAAGLLPPAIVRMLHGPAGDGVLDLDGTVAAMTRYAEGAAIEVTAGPFAYFPGVVVGHEGRNVKVLLSIFNRPMPFTMAPDSIQPAAA